jgi:photosystem II stability/assembly factor-like uncharacterized protein
MKKITTLLFIFLSISFYGQWVQQNSGITENLNDVYCLTDNTVFVVGANGKIIKTIDGGLNWIQKTSGTTASLSKVQFVNQNTGYAVGFNGTVLKTIDGGDNWSSISIGSTTNLYGLSVLNENTLFISGDNGLVKKTIDGGATFSVINVPQNETVSNIQFFNELVGYAQAGNFTPNYRQNNLYKTIDGGITWSLVINEPIDSFFFLNENIGFISKTNNGIYKTIDSGLNLNYVGYYNKSIELDIFATSENIVWDIGNDYTLCNCDSYCVSKKEIGIQQIDNCGNANVAGFLYNAIYFANDTTGYIVGISGRVFKNTTGTMQEATANITEFNKSNIQVYPNPTTGIITFSENIALTSAEIVDGLGRSVKQFSKVENNTLSIEELTNGVYFCIIQSQGKKITRKIILEK